ncbi:MAG: hypothetical protein IT191_05755, partial [Microbacteriaceae bacterium]|nr:hypothetical protein [Microbacteriaceae bacterium]
MANARQERIHVSGRTGAGSEEIAVPEVVSIYDAKTQLSKLVKRARAGETIFIGAFGKPEAILAPLPKKPKIRFGVLESLRDPNFDDSFGA